MNLPPAIRSPLGRTASAKTISLSPAPRTDHVEPFQRAMFPEPKYPPAITSPLGITASAYTYHPGPAPSGDHDEPSQRATNRACTPPAAVNCPAATRSPLG